MAVIVTPPSTINVRIGSATQPRITQTSTFQGAVTANVQNEINSVISLAENASNGANIAFSYSNTALSVANNALPLTGGNITGNLVVTGTFTGLVDGGTF